MCRPWQMRASLCGSREPFSLEDPHWLCQFFNMSYVHNICVLYVVIAGLDGLCTHMNKKIESSQVDNAPFCNFYEHQKVHSVTCYFM